MMTKFLLLVCLLPLAFAGDMSWEMMDMGGDKKDEGGMNWGMGEEQDGGMDWGMGEEKKDEGGMDWGMGEEKDAGHYAGDGDCDNEKEADMKQKMFMMMMHKKMEMMKKKKAMKEAYYKFMKFQKEMAKKKKEKEEEEKKQKEQMMEEYKKMAMLKKKQEKAEALKEMMEQFKKQKHMMAFKLTHSFLAMCKCGEINMQLEKMTFDNMTSSNSDLADNMATDEAMQAWDAGDMAAVAEHLKKMPKEQQTKMFMAGLIKSMCAGAKTFVAHANQFQERYMMD